MKDSNSSRKEILLQSLNYVGKLISTAVIVVLLLIGAFLIYYVVSAKIVSKSEGVVPKLSLYTIVSGSMTPAIKVYDVILDFRIDDPSKIKVGDVITFKSTSSISRDMTVTHRVMDIRKVDGKYEFVTKGDNNPTADSDTAKEDNLIGKTFLKIPQLGRIQFFLATKMGWFIIVLIPALGVIIYDIIKLFRIMGVKGTSDSVDSTDGSITDFNKKEENKKITKTLEKIRKNKYADQISKIEEKPINTDNNYLELTNINNIDETNIELSKSEETDNNESINQSKIDETPKSNINPMALIEEVLKNNEINDNQNDSSSSL